MIIFKFRFPAAVSVQVSNPNARALLEQRKREFVKYSKRFSTTLKGTE